MTNKATTCRGCKFLYLDGSGYSNWTWMETYVRCAKEANPALLLDQSEPYDWQTQAEGEDMWPPTMNSRCELYSPGPLVTLDPDRQYDLNEFSNDQNQIETILQADRKIYSWRSN